MKRLLALSLLIVAISSCKKGDQQQACGVKACTYEFRSITINFVNSADQPQNVISFKAVNLRTGLDVERPASLLSSLHTFTIADDSKLSQFSTQGDDILITASVNNQTKKAVVNVAGGCNCHVERKSGPQTVKFD